MSITHATRPGDAPAASTPEPRLPAPLAWPIAVLAFFTFIGGFILAIFASNTARDRGYKTGKYWLAAFAPAITAILALVLFLGVLSSGTKNLAAAPTGATPSTQVVAAVPTVSNLGYHIDKSTTDYDLSNCSEQLPAQADHATLSEADAVAVAKQEFKIINAALATRNVNCASLMGWGKEALFFNPMGPAELTIKNVRVEDNGGGGWNAYVTYTMSDNSTRPFNNNDTAANPVGFSLTAPAGTWLLS